jgi:hypothetical protein
MRLRDVIASFGKAVTGQHVGTDCLALLAILNAILHGFSCGTHRACYSNER